MSNLFPVIRNSHLEFSVENSLIHVPKYFWWHHQLSSFDLVYLYRQSVKWKYKNLLMLYTMSFNYWTPQLFRKKQARFLYIMDSKDFETTYGGIYIVVRCSVCLEVQSVPTQSMHRAFTLSLELKAKMLRQVALLPT